MNVCVDAGHGGRDSGAVNGNTLEKDIALKVALKLYKLIESDYNVTLTRNKDSYVSLQDRVEISNKFDSDFFVSIHVNSSQAPYTATGIETLIYENKGDTKRLAENVQNSLISNLGAVNRGIKIRNDLYVLKNTKCPAILVEIGFIHADVNNLLNNEYQDKIALSIARGLNYTTGVSSNMSNDGNKSAIEMLKDRKILNNPEYWENASKCVLYLSDLLDNIKQFLIKNNI